MGGDAQPTHAGTRITRRRFVRLGAGAAGAAIVAGPLAACGGSPQARREQVVVIGAGLAGLACAYRLHQRGISSGRVRGAPRPRRRALLDRPGVRRRPGGRARRRVHRHGPSRASAGWRTSSAWSWRTARPRPAGPAAARPADLRRPAGLRPRALRGMGLPSCAVLRATGREVGYLQGRDGPAARALDRLDALAYLDRTVPGGAGSLLGQACAAYLASELRARRRRPRRHQRVYLRRHARRKGLRRALPRRRRQRSAGDGHGRPAAPTGR